jgi:amino acid transporter
MLAANHGYLPRWLYQLNPHGIPARVLILQAVLVTIFCGGFLLFPSINAMYWLFTDLSTEIYILMYVMMFAAAIRLKHKFAEHPRPFSIPGGRIGYYLACLIGLTGCTITLIVGFFPPEQSIDVGGANHFRIIFIAGILLMLSPAGLLCLFRRKV